MARAVRYLFLAGVFMAVRFASGQSTNRMPVVGANGSQPLGFFERSYEPKRVSPLDENNSPRIYDLLRGGNLYLSLADTIALAIENNLSVQTARIGLAISGTDVERAKGGGTLRGVGVVSFQLPTGVGGPASPLITGAATGAPPVTSVPTDIFDLTFFQPSIQVLSPDQTAYTSPLPTAAGPPIPQFDPVLAGSVLYGQSEVPQNSLLSNNTNLVTRSLSSNLSLIQGFSTGTTYSLTFNTDASSSNNLLNRYNPLTTGSLGLTVTQPLLRGFGPAVNRRWIRIAKNDEKISDLVFRQDLLNLVYGVSRLYYDLASLAEDLQEKRETLASAQELLKNTTAGVELGTQAQVELTRASAQTAGAEQDVINAEGLFNQEEELLKNVITRKGPREPAIQAARIVVTDELTVPSHNTLPELSDLLTQAEKARPDLAALDLELKNDDIALEGTRNALLPEVDIVGSVQSQGLAGSVVNMQSTASAVSGMPPMTPFAGGSSAALDQIFSWRYPSYQIGVQLSLPVRNRVAQADMTRDILQKRAFEAQRAQVRNQAALEIDAALIALRRARSAYDAAVRTRRLQEESLDVERARYEAGVDTAFFVIQYQAYLSQARSTEVVAKGDYFKAVIGLQRAVGSLLEENNISIEDAKKGNLLRQPSIPGAAPNPAAPRR